MFRKILASVGIGAANVDLSLPKTRFSAGEVVNGQLRIGGGMIDQKVDKVYLRLLLTSSFKKGDQMQNITREFASATIAEGFEVRSGSSVQNVPVMFAIPEAIPISTNPTRYYLLTGLDIASAVDPKDTDGIEILPGPRQAVIMQAIENQLGFRRKQRTGEYNGRFQEFEYRPGNFMLGKLDELEVVYQVERDGVRLFMQIDKKARGLLGMIAEEWDLDERHVSLFVPNAQITTPHGVAQYIADFIDHEYRRFF
jgi:sporulation-control protein